jgi:Cu(I)/Ag(I) efflux system membrane protein CusA/SilA
MGGIYVIFDANGEGEVVGGIVVMRYGENADKYRCVKLKMKEVEGLPEGVTFKTSYDRSELKAIESVKGTLIEEMIAVSIVILLFFSIGEVP